MFRSRMFRGRRGGHTLTGTERVCLSEGNALKTLLETQWEVVLL